MLGVSPLARPGQSVPMCRQVLRSPHCMTRMTLPPHPGNQIQLWSVDKRVGNVKNEGPELAVPTALAGKASGGEAMIV